MMITREWMIDHLEIESTVLHKESEEAQIQMQREGANKLGGNIKLWCSLHCSNLRFSLTIITLQNRFSSRKRIPPKSPVE